ncbi:CHASE2 domain-containing protein [Muricoccus radiodurans]|uniref:CHASE2 domain-containing protein n=1 Tax=Muricoccus radiodurans TaxID=2231721 RepID=UPI003CF41D00
MAAAILAGAALLFAPLADDLRDSATDLLMQAVPRTAETAPVLAVAVTGADLTSLGPWPWPRERLAEVVNRLSGAGAAAIALDLVLAEPAAGDPALERALMGEPSLVALLAGPAPPPPGFAVAQIGRPDLSDLPALPGVEPSALPNAVGALAVLPGRTMRQVPMLARLGTEDRLLPGLALGILARALGVETLLLREGQLQLGAHILPLPRDGMLRLDPPRDPVPVLSAGAVLRGETGEARGRIVLIGVTAPEEAPLRPSVLGPFTPSLLVQAEAAAQLAAGWVPLRPSGAAVGEALAALLLGLLSAAVVRRWPGPGLAAAVLLAVLWPLAALAALRMEALLIDPTLPAAGALLGGVAEAAAAARRLARERTRLLSRFAHRLPTGVAEQLLARPESERLRPELCRVAVVMTDLAGFSTTVRNHDPAAVVTVLNAYLSGVEAAVLAEGGTLERLIGDSVLAVFGAPLARADDDARALAAARAIDRFAEAFRRRPEAVAIGWGETRIGVAAGEVLAGEVGGSRLTWAVCGDAANVAARLQELGKTVGRRALVTGIEDPSLPPPIGRFALRGLTGEAEVRPLDRAGLGE